MKLQRNNQLAYESNMALKGQDAKISEENIHKLWDLLQNPYKNPIGAIVREYVSNSFDAHAEAEFIKNNDLHAIRNEYSIYHKSTDQELNTLKRQLNVFDDDAVVVTISKDSTGYYWSTEDFGVGLSEERVTDVFCSYLSSTKEESNNVIGAFGIGSKSGLSYSDVVHIRTRYNNIEYIYLLRKGEKQPRLDLFSQNPTSERNGTEIKIYIKEDRKEDSNDKERFIEECKKQLVYFDNVYFRGDMLMIPARRRYSYTASYERDQPLSNDYKIIRGTNWMKNDLNSPFKGLHLCLGKVAYPIDWDNISEVKEYDFPVALRFEIGELDIIQTREDVKYTPRTKKAIRDKIKLLIAEFEQRWENDKELETEDLLYYMDVEDSSPTLEYEGVSFDLSELYPEEKFKDKLPWFTFKPFQETRLPIPTYPFFDYSCDHYIGGHGLRKAGNNVTYLMTHGDKNVYRVKDNTVARKSKYIRYELENDEDVYLIRRKPKYSIKLTTYVKWLNLDWDDRANWRSKIKLYQDTITKAMLKRTKSYDRVVVDKTWIANTYGARKTIDRSKIVAKQLLEYYVQGNNYSWHRTELIKYKIDQCVKPLKIVGTYENREKLQTIALYYHETTAINLPRSRTDMKGRVIVYTVAPTNLKYFNDLPNTITIDNFMSKNNKVFSRAMSIRKLKEDKNLREARDLIDKYSKYYELWNKIYEPLGKDLEFINEYRIKNKVRDYNIDLDFMDSCYRVACEKNLFDDEFLDKVKNVQQYFKGLEILHYLTWKNTEDFPYLHIARYIRNHNKGLRNIKGFKRINSYYYVMFNNEEVSWLKDNRNDETTDEHTFVEEKQLN